jgi:hypothetical protein
MQPKSSLPDRKGISDHITCPHSLSCSKTATYLFYHPLHPPNPSMITHTHSSNHLRIFLVFTVLHKTNPQPQEVSTFKASKSEIRIQVPSQMPSTLNTLVNWSIFNKNRPAELRIPRIRALTIAFHVAHMKIYRACSIHRVLVDTQE